MPSGTRYSVPLDCFIPLVEWGYRPTDSFDMEAIRPPGGRDRPVGGIFAGGVALASEHAAGRVYTSQRQ